MKRQTSFEQTIVDFKNVFDREPTKQYIEKLWHKYTQEWKHFDNFIHWLTYQDI